MQRVHGNCDIGKVQIPSFSGLKRGRLDRGETVNEVIPPVQTPRDLRQLYASCYIYLTVNHLAREKK